MSKAAKTIDDLVYSSEMERITNRGKSVDYLISEVKTEWAYNLQDRKPAPAYLENGNIRPTNLDMASIMSTLADRNAIINIPQYQSRRAKTKKEGEWVISDKNRHGKLIGLNADKEVFSFSARIVDQNVINTADNEIGAYRNFLLTDLEGELYKGLDSIQVKLTEDEERFMRKNGVSIGDNIPIKNFVTPQLWSSFLGAPYAKLKALETRLEDEAKYYRTVASELKENLDIRGVRNSFKHKSKTEVGESKPIKVHAFKAEMDIPMHGEYPSVSHTIGGYQTARKIAKELTYNVLPRLRFNSRTVELAFDKHGKEGLNTPGWDVPDIESEFIIPGKRTEWNKMDLGNDVLLRFRTYEKTERVNALS
ncbi:MAG: hypothetical protein PHU12_03100 [Candidatus Aenigmarchaeota archaeon]|nr:hypothetical protein [Candidatus Aenigmarchaeota archaeon]